MESQFKDFYTIFDNEDEDVTYSNDGFKEIAVNFDRIKASYNKCCANFFIKSKFYNYLRDDCRKVAFLFILPKTTFSIPIIASKAIHPSFGSGLVF